MCYEKTLHPYYLIIYFLNIKFDNIVYAWENFYHFLSSVYIFLIILWSWKFSNYFYFCLFFFFSIFILSRIVLDIYSSSWYVNIPVLQSITTFIHSCWKCVTFNRKIIRTPSPFVVTYQLLCCTLSEEEKTILPCKRKMINTSYKHLRYSWCFPIINRD